MASGDTTMAVAPSTLRIASGLLFEPGASGKHHAKVLRNSPQTASV